MKLVLLVIMLSLCVSCTNSVTEVDKSKETADVNQVIVDENQVNEVNENLISTNPEDEALLKNMNEITLALQKKDFKEFSNFIHPQEGIRFSRYGVVDFEQDIVLKKEDLRDAAENKENYSWGYYFSEEVMLETTIYEYFEKYIFFSDYSKADAIGINEKVTDVYTIPEEYNEVYPDSMIIEYYFNNDFPETLDWKSIRFVFKKYDDDMCLMGIICNEWTP